MNVMDAFIFPAVCTIRILPRLRYAGLLLRMKRALVHNLDRLFGR